MARTPDEIARDFAAFLDDALDHLERAAALDLHRRLFLLFHERFHQHLRSDQHGRTLGRPSTSHPLHP